jgi:hypothetical protein
LLVVVWFIQQMERQFISSNQSLLRTLKIISPNTSIPTESFRLLVLQRLLKGDTVLSPKDQTKYRSGVGILLYLVKTQDLTSPMQ